MKTRILLLLALSLVTLGLFGCGGSKDTEAAPATGTSSASTTGNAATSDGSATQQPKDKATTAPAIGENPNYNSGMGSKAK